MFLDPRHQGIQMKYTIYPFLWCYWERWLCFISSMLVQRRQSFHCRECQGLSLSFSGAISFLLWLCTCFGCWGFVLRRGFNRLRKVIHFAILSFLCSCPTITQSKNNQMTYLLLLIPLASNRYQPRQKPDSVIQHLSSRIQINYLVQNRFLPTIKQFEYGAHLFILFVFQHLLLKKLYQRLEFSQQDTLKG